MMQVRLNHAVIFASILLFAQAASADFIQPVGIIASGQSTYAESLIDDSGMRVEGDRVKRQLDVFFDDNYFRAAVSASSG